MIFTVNESQNINETTIIVSGGLDLALVDTNQVKLYTFDGVNYNLETYSVSSDNQLIYIYADQLVADVLYVIILQGVTNNSNVVYDTEIIKFIAYDDTSYTSPNNVQTKFKYLNDIISLDKLFNRNRDFEIKFQPSLYNNETEKYEYINNEIINYPNEDIIYALIHQYFTEYETFYKIINDRDNLKSQFANTFTQEYINNLHLLFMKNIVKFSSLKGSKYLIELMLMLYSRYLGEFTISVVENTSQNFVYHVSSSITTAFWNTYIKPYVHPMGWSCIYSEIPNISTALTNKPDIRNLFRNNYIGNSISYLDAEYYNKTYNIHFGNLQNIFHSNGYVLAETASAHNYGHHTIDCSFRNFEDQSVIGLNLNGYKYTDFDYVSVSGVAKYDKTLKTKDIKNIYFEIDRLNKTVLVKYKFTGLAYSYDWDVFTEQTLRKQSYQTGVSMKTFQLNSLNDYITLKLRHNEWEEPVIRVDNYCIAPRKTMVLDFAINEAKTKFLTVRNQSKRGANENGISVESFESEFLFTTVSYTNNNSYNFGASGFLAAIDAPSALYSAKASATTSINGVPYRRLYIKYNVLGIAAQYNWTVKINGINTFEYHTSNNILDIKILDSDFNNVTVYLNIDHFSGSYNFTNFITASSITNLI